MNTQHSSWKCLLSLSLKQVIIYDQGGEDEHRRYMKCTVIGLEVTGLNPGQVEIEVHSKTVKVILQQKRQLLVHQFVREPMYVHIRLPR